MSFLQPILLAGLPLVALPIVIHLINQRRYQTMRWAAMMFLLAANRMSRGYARLRQWLIMAFRMAAIAALILAVSRPLAGGWLGLTAGGRADTTLVLLDRSPSMQQSSSGGGGTKLETGTRQLARTFKAIGSTRWVLIESGTNRARELESADALLTATDAGPCSASADLPAMLEAARDYIKANKTGRTEIWICSDVRQNDWNPESGRWKSLRDAFLEFPQGVRFHLLAYPKSAPANVALRVTSVRRHQSGEGAEVVVSLRLEREAGGATKETIPIRFEIGGARSELSVELLGPKFELKEHRIPLGHGVERGWGLVSIPADANLADNVEYFVFDKPVARRAAVVAEDPQASQPLQLAASITTDPSIPCAAEMVDAEHLTGVDWEGLSLLLWEGPLPEKETARLVRAFIERGGRAIFFPPRAGGGEEFLGARWTSWPERSEALTVESWRGDQDVLARTQSGAALPVGDLQIERACGLAGEFTRLATLRGNLPLLARVTTNAGGAYFCCTTPAPGDSNLAGNGVVLYALVQRAMAEGASALEHTRHLEAGEPLGPGEDPARWKRLAGNDTAISTDYPIHQGVYSSADRLLAVNRPSAEDATAIVAGDKVAGLFRGLDFARVDDQAGSLGSLVQEVWRVLLATMMVALVVEAGLCLPRPARLSGAIS